MKISRNIFLFSVLNLICTCVFIKYLPDQVVFGLTGNFFATEFVSRWTNLIMPIIQVVCSFIILLIDILRPREHKYRYLTAWVAISCTTFVMWVQMVLQINNTELGTAMDWPWTLIILFPFALFFLAEGMYVMHKDMDDFSIFGTKTIRSSSYVWLRTHRVAGVTLIIVAFVLFVIAVLNELLWHTWWILLIAFLVWFVIHYLFTLLCAYSFAKNNN